MNDDPAPDRSRAARNTTSWRWPLHAAGSTTASGAHGTAAATLGGGHRVSAAPTVLPAVAVGACGPRAV